MAGWDGFLSVRHEGARCLDTAALMYRATDQMIPLAEFVNFSEQVVEETRDVAIPWLVGTNYDLNALGPIGSAVRSAGKVGIAIRRLIDCFSLLQDCTDISLSQDDGMATVSYRILDPAIWPRHHDAMFSLGIIAQIIRRGADGEWDKVEFAFEAEQAELHGDISSVLRAPCSFGADSNQMRFPVALLDLGLQPVEQCADVRPIVRQMVEQRRSTPLVKRLENLIFRDLNSVTIDQERMAREVGMSSRTMRRKLADEGTSFQQVLDECRMRQAAFEFRTRPGLSIAQIALRLGYAEHSNFTRAFQRWSGISPQTYRTRIAQTSH
ncbi:MAG: AraC family transcriptional regulator [Alphaproteobacteria bacterium]|nr:AraC family transcriptional regulator [Alphaproteobacteria bacterium]MBU0875874.1 AraC family transcriptional regulator [Alphaproteobacteria bacterium]MBU1769946.1 AraC family transcriptional regulator [Alphaproteobacteria bacterium]